MTDESTMTELKDGTKEWYLNGERHREQAPAVISPGGSKEWWKDGERHNEDGPAIIDSDGFNAWYLNGQLHREDGPAVIWPDGYKAWYEHDELIYSTEMGEENPTLKKVWKFGSREEFDTVKALIS